MPIFMECVKERLGVGVLARGEKERELVSGFLLVENEGEN